MRSGRNTPTGVGKTDVLPGLDIQREKHPHRRGEDLPSAVESVALMETPPQAWGRLPRCRQADNCHGNTPTGVGKTDNHDAVPLAIRKHPHRRGEDDIVSMQLSCQKETPPQAWGRLVIYSSHNLLLGNTPTGVGKTTVMSKPPAEMEKHPHRRGEDSKESLNFLTNALCHHSLSFSRTSCNPLMRTSSRR